MELPPSVDEQGPTLATLVEVGQILEEAQDEAPLSLSEINRRMEAKRTRHRTIRACVDFLEHIGFVTTGSKGVQWTHRPDARGQAEYETDLLDPDEDEDTEVPAQPHARAAEAWERQERWKARREPVEAFYEAFGGPIQSALAAVAEDIDYQAALKCLEEWEAWMEDNQGRLQDIGADGAVRGSSGLIVRLFRTVSAAREALRAEAYDRAVEELRTARDLIRSRRADEQDALEQARKYHVFDAE